MRQPRHCIRSILALAICAAFGTAHQAQADVISTSSIDVTSLRFRLIDLDPNDGIAPALSINGQWWGRFDTATAFGNGGLPEQEAAQQDYMQLGQASATLPSASANAASGHGSLSLGAGQLSASSDLTTGQLLNQSKQGQVLTPPEQTFAPYTDPVTGQARQLKITSFYNGGTLTYGSSGASILSGSFNSSDPAASRLALSLTPHTQLVIEGSTNIQLYADRSNLSQASANVSAGGTAQLDTPGTYVERYKGASGVVNASVWASLHDTAGSSVTPSYTNVGYGIAYTDSGMSVIDYFTPTGSSTVIDLGAVTSHALDQSRDWSVQMSNAGATNKALTFELFANSYATQALLTHDKFYDVALLPLPGGNGTIPEPGTYALMGLGLAGIALARRRVA